MAGINLGELFIQLGMDDSKFNRSIVRNTKKINQFGSQFSSLAKTATVSFVSIASVVAVGTAAFVKAASSATELQNVIDVTFAENSKNIDVWASRLSDVIGRSGQDLKEFAGIAGSNLRAAGFASENITKMSKSITMLSQDLSSFRDKEPEKAFSALMSGITGSSIRPLRQFGIDIGEATLKVEALKMGLGGNLDALNQQQKMLLRLNVALKQSTFLQGDAEKTVTSYANATKAIKGDLKDTAVAIGNEFLPAATTMINSIRDITKLLKKVDFGKLFNSEFVKNITGVIKSFMILTGAVVALTIATTLLTNPFILWGVAAAFVIGAIKTDFLGLGTVWEKGTDLMFKFFKNSFKSMKIVWETFLPFILQGINTMIDQFGALKIFIETMGIDPFSAFFNGYLDMVQNFQNTMKFLIKPFAWAFQQILTLANEFILKMIKTLEDSPMIASKKVQELVAGLKKVSFDVTQFDIEDKAIAMINSVQNEVEKLKIGDSKVKSIIDQVDKATKGYKDFVKSVSTGGEEFDKILNKIKETAPDLGKTLMDGFSEAMKEGTLTISSSINDIFDEMVKKTGLSADEMVKKVKKALKSLGKSKVYVDTSSGGQSGAYGGASGVYRRALTRKGDITEGAAVPNEMFENLKTFFSGQKDSKGNTEVTGVIDMFLDQVPLLSQAVKTFTNTLSKTNSPMMSTALTLAELALSSEEMQPVIESLNNGVMEVANAIGKVLKPVLEVLAKAFAFMYNYTIRPFINGFVAGIRFFGKILKELGRISIAGWKPFEDIGKMGESILDNIQYLDKMEFKGFSDSLDDATDSADDLSDALSTIANDIPNGLKLAFKNFNSQMGVSQVSSLDTSSFSTGSQVLASSQGIYVNITSTEEFQATVTKASNSASANQNLVVNGNNLMSVMPT